ICVSSKIMSILPNYQRQVQMDHHILGLIQPKGNLAKRSQFFWTSYTCSVKTQQTQELAFEPEWVVER
ncbi:MAG: hypothetical protein AAF696_35805, partial [Bacteroidota bacterium]